MKKSRLILLTILLAVATVIQAGAAVYYVDISRPDNSGDGLSWATAWKTLHWAANETAESSGHTIHVAAGVYSVANGEPDSPLQFYLASSSILGDPAGGTIIDATSPMYYWPDGLTLYSCSGVTLSDFEIINAPSNGIYIDGGNGNTITGCNVHNNQSNGIYVYYGTGHTISGCDVHDNGYEGGNGIYLFEGSGHTVTGCAIYNNLITAVVLYNCNNTNAVLRNRIYDSPEGINIEADDADCSPDVINNLIFRQAGSMFTGIVVSAWYYLAPTTAAPRIFHNTIVGATSFGIAMNSGISSLVSPDIRYNIITGCGTGIADTGALPPINAVIPASVDYNDLFGNTTNYVGVTPGANSLNLDPVYVAPGTFDYQLQNTSPCIDAAVTSPITQDLVGTARPQGVAPDMGCYENSPALPAGIIVNPTSGLMTSEDGTSDTFTVVLNSQPTADVNIPLSSSDPGEGAVLPASLLFTSGNWDIPQTVTVSGVDDNLLDGDIAYTVIIGAATSPDILYNGLNAADINAVNLDNDNADIIVIPASGLTTGEDGTSDTFKVVLGSQPLSDVNITLSSSDPGEGVVQPTALNFNVINWFLPQTVTVTGVDDSLIDGDIAYTIIINPATSRNPYYNGLDAPDIDAVNLDNDRADIIVNPTSGLVTSKAGGRDTFTVVLNSQPTAPVDVALSSSDSSNGLVSPDWLTFTANNWNTPQTVTVTGQDDMTDEDVPYTIITAPAVSRDVNYDGLDPDDVSVTNIDNLPPAQPRYVYPGPSQLFAPGEGITLRGSEFFDSEGDKHIGSYWLIGLAGRSGYGCDDYPDAFRFFSTTALTAYTIPYELLKPGVLYKWAVGYQDGGSGVFTWSDMNENTQNVFMIGQEETYVAPPFPPGDTPADFRMLSCHHYILGNSSAAVVIGDDLDGGYDTRYYRIGTFDPDQSDGNYLEYPDFNLYPGTGVWVLARNGLTVDITGIPVTTDEDVEFELRFNEKSGNGWNMIGPPNDRSYPWGSLEIVVYAGNNACTPAFGPEPIAKLEPNNPFIDIRLWEWGGDDYTIATMLSSDNGYWVKAKQAGVFLRFPASAQVSLNNPRVLLATGSDKIKETALKLISPTEALAEDNSDSPPRPMKTVEDNGNTGSFGASDGGNCFINTLFF